MRQSSDRPVANYPQLRHHIKLALLSFRACLHHRAGSLHITLPLNTFWKTLVRRYSLAVYDPDLVDFLLPSHYEEVVSPYRYERREMFRLSCKRVRVRPSLCPPTLPSFSACKPSNEARRFVPRRRPEHKSKAWILKIFTSSPTAHFLIHQHMLHDVLFFLLWRGRLEQPPGRSCFFLRRSDLPATSSAVRWSRILCSCTPRLGSPCSLSCSCWHRWIP